MDNEEAFEKWLLDCGYYPDVDESRKIFLAACKFKDTETMELKYELDFLSNVATNNLELVHKNEELKDRVKYLEDGCAKVMTKCATEGRRIQQLEEKLKVAVEALSYYEKLTNLSDNAKYALKKIKAK